MFYEKHNTTDGMKSGRGEGEGEKGKRERGKGKGEKRKREMENWKIGKTIRRFGRRRKTDLSHQIKTAVYHHHHHHHHSHDQEPSICQLLTGLSCIPRGFPVSSQIKLLITVLFRQLRSTLSHMTILICPP